MGLKMSELQLDVHAAMMQKPGSCERSKIVRRVGEVERKAKAGEMAIELAKYLVSTHSAHSEYVVQRAQAVLDTLEGSNGPKAD